MISVEIEKCLRKANRACLNHLEKLHHLPKAAYSTESARVYDARGGTFLPAYQMGVDICGLTNSYQRLADLEKEITLRSNHASIPVGRVAIGAVLDSDTKPEMGSGMDLRVIIALGINYGQQKPKHQDYLHKPPGLYDKTGLRPKLDAVIRKLAACQVADSEQYHLVVANFFPWITNEAWGDHKFNSISETLLFEFFGWYGPTMFASSLIHCLQASSRELVFEKSVTHIVVHGANNRAPYEFGRLLTSTDGPLPLQAKKGHWPLKDVLRPRADQELGPDIIFCDNLAPPLFPVRNAVCLRKPAHPVNDPSAVLSLDE